MEEKKKMVFNNKVGKTEYMVVPGNKGEVHTVTEKVKKGFIPRVKEHKMLGTWVDESIKYGINITKRREKLQYMIGSINRQPSPSKVGIYAVPSRLKLAEIVIIPSILHNAEAFPTYTENEVKQLDSVQHSILTGVLNLPMSTPYNALLMEVGWWTMRARLGYRKLMLYHNIMNSDKKRPIKRIIHIQKNEERETTWYRSVEREMEKYDIKTDPKTVLKSTWKKEVKDKITTKVGEEIREKCKTSKKARNVVNDEFKMKDYLSGKTTFKDARRILSTRLNMNKVPGNYKGNSEGMCPLCEKEEGNNEHYFKCQKVRVLREVWGVEKEDLVNQELKKMTNLGFFMEKVEVMVNPF